MHEAPDIRAFATEDPRAILAQFPKRAVIFPEASGHVPGLTGRLNPIRDTLDRTYLYSSHIAINEGLQQPAPFVPGEDLRLTDADGREKMVRIVDIVGRSALVEYRSCPEGKD